MSLPLSTSLARVQDNDKLSDGPNEAIQADCNPSSSINQPLDPGSLIEEDTTSRLAAFRIENASIPRRSGLLQLSNELIIPIIAHMYHQDLVNLALSCKLLHALARSALNEHQTLIQELSLLSSSHGPRYLSRVSRSVFEESKRGLYVRQLVLRRLIRTWISSEPGDRTDAKWILTEAKRGAMKDFINQIATDAVGQFHPGIKQDLMRSIAQGDEMPLLTFLCVILPNLSNLEVRLRRDHHDWQLEILTTVLLTHQLENVNERRFTNLKTVKIHGPVYIQDQTFDLLRTCAQIPSVENLSCVNCRLNSDFRRTFKGSSNVKYLELLHCAIDTKTIQSMVFAMKQLKKFTYSQSEPSSQTHPRPDPSGLRIALVYSARKSLEVLEITGVGHFFLGRPVRIGPLNIFESLRHITADVEILLREEPWHSRTDEIVNDLPQTVRKLRLGCRHDIKSALDTVNQLASPFTPSLLHLESLELIELDKEHVQGLKEAGRVDEFAALGIALSFPAPYIASSDSSSEDEGMV